jgi:hypothetical protein
VLSKLWDEILKTHLKPTFTKKAIFQIWSKIDSQNWKRDEDELKSAKMLLEEARKPGKHGLYTVEPIPLHEEDGLTAIAFALPDILRKFGGRVRELSLDSTCEFSERYSRSNKLLTLVVGNTNGSRYEVYALLGEVYGSGMPLGYLLVQSKDSASGAKERYLREFLNHIQNTWEVRPVITLTDKDWSEINACVAEFPDAKHQLCFWHCLRALKKRLSILRRAPAFYNVGDTRNEFNWIDQDFVPVGQAKPRTQVSAWG